MVSRVVYKTHTRKHAHTHTHTHTYVCVCVCVCVWESVCNDIRCRQNIENAS